METMLQAEVSVRVLLRRVSDARLHSDDIRQQLGNLLRGYSRDIGISERERQTAIIDVEIEESDIDFLVNFDLSDVEVSGLSYAIEGDSGLLAWREVQIVDLSTFARHFDQPYVAAAFYGESQVKLNVDPGTAASFLWQLSYRESSLASIASNAKVPLPSDFFPMLVKEAAVLCMPLVRDDSAEWIAWMDRTLPLYENTILEWNNPNFKHSGRGPGRWQHYTMSSSEPQIQNIRRSNAFRQRPRRARGFLPVQ